MNYLNNKYRNNKLSLKELHELRKKVHAISDNELEAQLYDIWLHEEIDTSFIDEQRLEDIKRNIDSTIGKDTLTDSNTTNEKHMSTGEKKQPVLSLIIRWGQIAAAILLPVFILLTAYFYRENNRITSEEMIVSTQKGERANITLPDGTTVYLNSDSQLGYTPKEYNQKERNINFAGEGYFQVFRNNSVPFFINAKGLQVKVLGTTFNLSVRELDNTAELALEEGSVLLTSTKSNKNVILKPNEKAILDQQTGEITIVFENDIRHFSAWRRGELIFRNSELAHILKTIEDNYNVTIKIDCEDCHTDKFTGTLPLSDLNEVLEVLEISYHLKAEITGKEILLRNNI